MQDIKHLDCTLRDGGYYNNWDFPYEIINQYLSVLNDLNIEYCEIGFRFLKNKGFRGSCAFTKEEFLSTLEIPSNLKIAVMINASELFEDGNLILERIKKLIPLKKSDSKVSMVRVACHSKVIEKISPVFDFLSEYGYLSACNITQISDKTPKELLKLGSLLSKTKVNVVYFADSLGSATPFSISEIIQTLKKNGKDRWGSMLMTIKV